MATEAALKQGCCMLEAVLNVKPVEKIILKNKKHLKNRTDVRII